VVGLSAEKGHGLPDFFSLRINKIIWLCDLLLCIALKEYEILNVM